MHGSDSTYFGWVSELTDITEHFSKQQEIEEAYAEAAFLKQSSSSNVLSVLQQ
jgi:hypothetical protein